MLPDLDKVPAVLFSSVRVTIGELRELKRVRLVKTNLQTRKLDIMFKVEGGLCR